MLPLKDINPTKNFPVVTLLIIIINVIVFILEITFSKELIVEKYGLSFKSLFYLHDYKTLITHMFIHGNFSHIFFNMFYLWIFGNNIEDELGSFRFLLFYLIGGITAAIPQVLFTNNIDINLIGASGAVSAILGAYLKLYPTAPILTVYFIFIFIGFTYIPAFIFIILWFIINLLNLLFNYSSNVAYLAHIIGFIFGFLFIDLFRFFKAKKNIRYKKYYISYKKYFD
ncbi:MAG: rhomboid family intramembrane serine protease [bacterium]|jgi:membrane associated rhomboid family serine protease